MMQKNIFQQVITSIALMALILIIITGCKNQSSKTDTKSNPITLRDDTLKGFLLAGVYFVQGYGGVTTFMDKVKDDINKNTAQKNFLTMLDTAYHHYFMYPYPRSVAEKVDARNTLSGWFQINNQNDFYAFLASLKDSGFQAHYLICRKALDENGGVNAAISKIDLGRYNLPKGSEVLLKFVKNNYNKFSPSGIKAWNIGLYVYTVCLGYGAEYIDAQNGKSIIVQMLLEAQKDYPDWKTYYNDFMLGRQFAGTDPSANAAYQKTIDGMLLGDYSAYKYLPLHQ